MKFHFFKQEKFYTCGPAALRMILHSLGIKRSETLLARKLFTSKRYGTLNKRFPPVVESYRFSYIVKRNANIRDIKQIRKNGYRVMVCYFYETENVFHYAVIKKVGIKYVYLWDPENGPNHRLSREYFRKVWKGNKFHKEVRWLMGVKN